MMLPDSRTIAIQNMDSEMKTRRETMNAVPWIVASGGGGVKYSGWSPRWMANRRA